MDQEVRKELLNSLDIIVKAGESELDEKVMKKVKSICKKDNGYIEAAHHFLLAMLNEGHSQIRLSVLQVCHELFLRSGFFRSLLLENFKDFVELVVLINPAKPLPPPVQAAKALNDFALKSLREWNSKYSDSYVRLRVGFNYLMRTKKKEFDDLERREEIQARKQALLKAQQEEREKRELEKASSEFRSMAVEMDNCGIELDTICNLLIPQPDDFLMGEMMEFKAAEDKEKPISSNGENLEESIEPDRFKHRDHGIANNFSLEINLQAPGRLEENEDNSDLLVQLNDHRKMFEKTYIPKLEEWIKTFSRKDDNKDQLKKCNDLKEMMHSRLEKLKSMNLCSDLDTAGDNHDEMSDSDLVDVPEKEAYEEDVVPERPTTSKTCRPLSQKKVKVETSSKTSRPLSQKKMKAEPCWADESIKYWNIAPTKSSEELKDPTVSIEEQLILGASSNNAESKETKEESIECDADMPGPSTSSGQTSSNVPNLPFDIDLINWGQETPSALFVRNEALHRFWKGSEGDEVVVSKKTIEAVTNRRTVTFSGTFEPVTHECRAPLPSGGLCQRRDRKKCPFHGVIIPRDELGQPVKQEDQTRIDAEQERAKAVAKRQALLEERRAKKASKLVNLKNMKDTPTSRVTKRVLNKASLKRVANVLNSIDARKRSEKFGNQFHYALTNFRKP